MPSSQAGSSTADDQPGTSATPSTSCSGQGGSNEGQSIPGPSSAESLHDIGTLAKPSASVEEISLKMCNLSNGERYTLLFHHKEPPMFARGCH